MKAILVFLSCLVVTSAWAQTACMSVNGDFSTINKGKATLIRLQQKGCESVDFSILLLKGDAVKPWFTATYKAGPGLKKDPFINGSSYELLFKQDELQLTMVQKQEGKDCTYKIQATRDQNDNLVGQVLTKCSGETESQETLVLGRLN